MNDNGDPASTSRNLAFETHQILYILGSTGHVVGKAFLADRPIHFLHLIDLISADILSRKSNLLLRSSETILKCLEMLCD